MPRSILLCLSALALLLSAPGPAAAHPGDVLPDLEQVVPTDLGVRAERVDGRLVWRLGFASASANVGAGSLTLYGHRASRRLTTMNVDQLVSQQAAAPRVIRDVGEMSYVVHPDHRHWHLLGFERYTLRRAGHPHARVRRDRKTGFCLGDRYAIPDAASLEGYDPSPAQGDECGLGQPGLEGLFAGISTGYADRYEAQIEGQYIDVTGARSGTYVLTHTVNGARRILERDYSNNASSVRFALRWYGAGPTRRAGLRILRRCRASATCPPAAPSS